MVSLAPCTPYRLGRLTPVDNIVLVEIVDGAQDLLNGLGGILLGKLSLFADSVE